jgi:hypothetical protein
MSFQSIIVRNEKLLFLTLAVLSLLETAFFSFAAIKGIFPHYLYSDLLYGLSFLILSTYWTVTYCKYPDSSLDKGLYVQRLIYFCFPYACLKRFGWIKGFGILLLFIIVHDLPWEVYHLITHVRLQDYPETSSALRPIYPTSW